MKHSVHSAFELIRVQAIPSLKIQFEEYRHTVTGAQHIHLAADNSENVFLEYQSSISDKKFIPVYNTEIKLNSRQQKMIGFEISYVHIIRNPIRMYNEWIKSERVLRERMQSSRIMNIRKKNISD